MYYTFVMGMDASVERLKEYGFEIERDGSNYMIAFPEEQAGRWEQFAGERLEEGYWNEYLAGDRVVFLFHLPEGIRRYEVLEYENDEVLALCEKLCGCQFGSIYNMLSGNHFYRDKLTASEKQ